jgi:uncharacterized protein DUF4157
MRTLAQQPNAGRQTKSVKPASASAEQGRKAGPTFRAQRTITNQAAHGLPESHRLHPCPCGGGCPRCSEQWNRQRQMKTAATALLGDAAKREDLPGDNEHAAENRTGMPDQLKVGLERLSGIDLSAIRVDYSSSQPGKFNALAYALGTKIYLGPSQERHLSHEAWHVVQQMQGRVKPTIQANGTLINDDENLEHEADVMGARALLVGEAGAENFNARMKTANGANNDDDMSYAAGLRSSKPAQNAAGQRTTPRISTTSVPVMQRTATFVPGTVSATSNLAANLIAGITPAGNTPPTLNGKPILNAAAARAAINAPTLGHGPAPDGTPASWVDTVPTNVVSWTMQLPSNGPHSTTAKKLEVRNAFVYLGLQSPAACRSTGDTTFTVNGKPNDITFAANTRTHENLHVADHQRAFVAGLNVWDAFLQGHKGAKTLFTGATVADSEAKLFATMGGTPDQVATNQHNLWDSLNNNLHAAGTSLATGGAATASNPAADATCTTSSLDVT